MGSKNILSMPRKDILFDFGFICFWESESVSLSEPERKPAINSNDLKTIDFILSIIFVRFGSEINLFRSSGLTSILAIVS